MNTMRVVVDRRRCTGIGICESLLPDRFEVDDDGTLQVHDHLVPAGTRAQVEEAVRACPAAALSLVEDPS